MYSPLTVMIEGTAMQLMHNGLLKNPLDPWAKQIRVFSKKRSKTDEDHVAMMEAEYKGSLYLFDENRSLEAHPYNGKHPFWPHDNIHACIKTAAKAKKLGKIVDTAMVVRPPGGRLIYSGPIDRNGLWDAGDPFQLVKPTRRGIMCCRPCFCEWAIEFCVQLDETVLDMAELKSLIKEAGNHIGLSDWPRRHGLFKIVSFKEEETTIDVTKHK